MAYRSIKGGVGTASNPFTLSKASTNYTTQYFKSTNATGDIRVQYIKNKWTAAGAGEVFRGVAEAAGSGVAAGGTLNAAHFTGRVATQADGTNATISGALNAVRATLEVAGTTPSPGGTLAAIQADSNIVTGATLPTDSSFIRVSDSGVVHIPNLFSLPAVENGHVIAAHSTQTNTHSIRFIAGGATYYIPCHATATGRS